MNKIFILTVLLLSATIALSLSEVAEENNNYGPVSNMMENLAKHTANVSNELLAKLLTKAEHTTKTLVADIEMLKTSAINELKQPIENFQSRISSSECQPLITLQQLNQQIDSDLSKCTQRMKEILSHFQQETNEIKVAFQKSIKEIIDLPKKCETEEIGASFGNKFNCFIGNIAGFNQQIAAILHNASETLVLTRQLREKEFQEGRICASNVIATTAGSLDKIVATCQLVEQ